MQRNCIFPGRYAPLTYYDWLRGASRNTLMARNAREICNVFAPQLCVLEGQYIECCGCFYLLYLYS